MDSVAEIELQGMESMLVMERKIYLDVAKLFATLCVINAHASFTHNPVRQTISAFFMPVFFIIYGMASSGKPIKSRRELFQFLEKRIKSLLVPYALWAMIFAGNINYTFIKEVLVGDNRSLGRADTNQVLWFLPCMFVAVILFQIYINIDSYITGRAGKIGIAVFLMVVCGVVSSKFNVVGTWSWDIAFSGCLFMIVGRGVRCLEAGWRDKANYIKIMAAALLFVVTYGIVSWNLLYLGKTGHHAVVMAVAAYGRYDLFVAGAITGSCALLLTAMVFDKVKLFAYMGRFSLVIMAVHFTLLPYIDRVCNRIQGIQYGDILYPAAAALCCLVICIPICYLIDWAVPELNGKAVRLQEKSRIHE